MSWVCSICYEPDAAEWVECDDCHVRGCRACYAYYLTTVEMVQCMFCQKEWVRERVARADMRWFLSELNGRVGDAQVRHEQGRLGRTPVIARLWQLREMVHGVKKYEMALFGFQWEFQFVLSDLRMIYDVLWEAAGMCHFDDDVFLRHFKTVFNGNEDHYRCGLCIIRRIGPSGVWSLDKLYDELPVVLADIMRQVFVNYGPYSGGSSLVSRIRVKMRAVLTSTPRASAVVRAEKCVGDGCSGVIRGDSRCSACGRFLCDVCRSMCADLNVHVCDSGVVASVAAVRAMGRVCPGKCGMQIVRSMGCDDMFCTIDHIYFSYATGEISTVERHNPHAIEWQQAQARKRPRRGRTAAAQDDDDEEDCRGAIEAWLADADRYARRFRSEKKLEGRLECRQVVTGVMMEAPGVFVGVPGDMGDLYTRVHRHTIEREYRALVTEEGREWPGQLEPRMKRALGEIDDAEFERRVRANVIRAEYRQVCANVFDGLMTATRELLADVITEIGRMPVVQDARVEQMLAQRLDTMIAFFGGILEHGTRMYDDGYGLVRRDAQIVVVSLPKE